MASCVGRKLGVGQDQIVPPVGGILGDVREAGEESGNVELQLRYLRARIPKSRCDLLLGRAFLAGQARDAHQRGQRRDAFLAARGRQRQGMVAGRAARRDRGICGSFHAREYSA